jgi:hypothetical protein
VARRCLRGWSFHSSLWQGTLRQTGSKGRAAGDAKQSGRPRQGRVCKHDPGFEEDLIVETDTKTFALWHTKQLEWAQALRAGRIRVTGPRALARALPTWNRRGF